MIKITHYDETEKKTHDSQIIRAEEYLKLSRGGPSYSQVSGTNSPIKALRQSRHWVCTFYTHPSFYVFILGTF